MINSLRNMVSVILLLSASFGCGTTTCNHATGDASFAFFLENTFTANRIDTFNSVVTTDWWMQDSTTTKLCFTPEELDFIREEMQRIDILNYPSEYKPVSGEGREFWIDPHPVYYLRVRLNGAIKETRWNNSNLSQIAGAKRLSKLFNDIQQILDMKPEYERIPRKQRGLQ